VSDAQIVGRLVDGAILVVRPEKNHRRLVTRACESFRSTGSHVIGVVANAVTTFSAAGYGYGYGYTYGNDDESAAESPYEPPSSQAA
jgi:Mrp family chromosome partitioning ATPase